LEGAPQADARQCGCWGRARRRRWPAQAISADTARSDLSAVGPQPGAVVPVRPLELNRLTTRVLFGSLMGAAGAAVILAGGWVFTAVTCAVVYQASQEFYGFVTSKVGPRLQAQELGRKLTEVAHLRAWPSPCVHGRGYLQLCQRRRCHRRQRPVTPRVWEQACAGLGRSSVRRRAGH